MQARIGDWIQTYGGKQFWPLDPRPEDIDLVDIAHALSMLCRFTGHTKRFYSVAEHSVHVSMRCAPTDALWGLLHDASEAYLVDLARPVKRQPQMSAYRDAEASVMRAVCAHFGLPSIEPRSVKEADNRMLYTEARDLMAPVHPKWTWAAEPYPDLEIVGAEPAAAKVMFLERFVELSGGRHV